MSYMNPRCHEKAIMRPLLSTKAPNVVDAYLKPVGPTSAATVESFREKKLTRVAYVIGSLSDTRDRACGEFYFKNRSTGLRNDFVDKGGTLFAKREWYVNDVLHASKSRQT